MLSATNLLKLHSTHYLLDAASFENHILHTRKQRGEDIPLAWYDRPFFYGLYLEDEKILGNRDIVVIPPFVLKPDFECEIAGFFTKDIKTANLDEAIAYVKNNMLFTIMNDFSARDAQDEDRKMGISITPSKGILPKAFGPKWVHGSSFSWDKNGIPDITMRVTVNGALYSQNDFQSSYFIHPKTRERKCWGFAQVIAWMGQNKQGFKHGHILGSGTIGGGCIAEFEDCLPYLQDGDVVRLEVKEIGALENTIHRTTAR